MLEVTKACTVIAIWREGGNNQLSEHDKRARWRYKYHQGYKELDKSAKYSKYFKFNLLDVPQFTILGCVLNTLRIFYIRNYLELVKGILT